MSGELTNELQGLAGGPGSATASATATAKPAGEGPMIVVPAKFIAEMIASILPSVGQKVGEMVGGEKGGKLGAIAGASSAPWVKGYLPFSVIPPSVSPASATPDATSGPSEAMIVVPSGFLTGLLGGVGGKLLGGVIGNVFGNKNLGTSIGGAAGGALGSVFGPFSVVPPATAGEDGAASSSDAAVLVPAGFLGDLVGAVSGRVGQWIGGDTGGQVGELAGGVLSKIIPWSALPPEVTPQSATPGSGDQAEDLVVVPAGWFSSLLANNAQAIGAGIGGLFGKADLGAKFGEAAKPLIGLAPFSVVPQELQPASAGPQAAAEDQLVVVPAGLFGGLLGTLSGVVSSFIPGRTGQIVGGVGGTLSKLLPFSVVPQ